MYECIFTNSMKSAYNNSMSIDYLFSNLKPTNLNSIHIGLFHIIYFKNYAIYRISIATH